MYEVEIEDFMRSVTLDFFSEDHYLHNFCGRYVVHAKMLVGMKEIAPRIANSIPIIDAANGTGIQAWQVPRSSRLP